MSDDWFDDNLAEIFSIDLPKSGLIGRKSLEAMEDIFGTEFEILKASHAKVFKFSDSKLEEYNLDESLELLDSAAKKLEIARDETDLENL